MGDAILEIESITPSKELKALLDKNKASIDIKHEKLSVDYTGEEFEVEFKITGNDDFSLNDDIELFDINYKVKELRGAEEDLIDDDQYRYMTLSGVNGEFKNSNGEVVDIKTGTMEKNMLIESNERTLIFGETQNYTSGMEEATIYAIDQEGNKYEPTYFKFEEMTERRHLFAFNNLPIIEGEYQVILEMPGSFKSVIDVPGSRVNSEGKTIGNIHAITTYSFTMPSPMQVVLGDVNEDGAIDILDAMEVGKLYVPTVFDDEIIASNTNKDSDERVAADLTQDGIVNFKDMGAVLDNYFMKDYLREDAKNPQAIYNGNDIYDVLEECGYFDEQPDMDVSLSLDKEELKAGETLNITAIPPVDYIEFDYEFSVRGENDDEWTVIQERSKSDSASWVAEEAGNYGVKVRIFYDEINYIWQDNKTVTVNPSDVVDPGDGDGNGDDNNGNNGGNGNNGNDGNNGNNSGDGTNKPSTNVKPDNNKPSTGNNKLPQTGGANALMTLALGLASTIGGAISFKKKK